MAPCHNKGLSRPSLSEGWGGAGRVHSMCVGMYGVGGGGGEGGDGAVYLFIFIDLYTIARNIRGLFPYPLSSL